MSTRTTIGTLAAVALVATVVAANWAIETFGFVPVGFGLVAPAGVYFAGLAFGLRDVVHDTLGRVAVVGCIVAGGLMSLAISPVFAVASAAAFVVSELERVLNIRRDKLGKDHVFLTRYGRPLDEAITEAQATLPGFEPEGHESCDSGACWT